MERVALAVVEGYPGVGTVKQENTHFAVIEFRLAGHRWEVVADSEEYTVIGFIHTPYELLEEA